MKLNLKLLILCIAVPLLVGGLAGLITSNSMMMFQPMDQPALSPPGWLFPIVWTILYTLMGISSYLILRTDTYSKELNSSLKYYILQLAVNFFWPIFFFTFEWYLFSFFWLLLLLFLVICTYVLFKQINKTAATLLIPYILWLVFAGYLNLVIALGAR